MHDDSQTGDEQPPFQRVDAGSNRPSPGSGWALRRRGVHPPEVILHRSRRPTLSWRAMPGPTPPAVRSWRTSEVSHVGSRRQPPRIGTADGRRRCQRRRCQRRRRQDRLAAVRPHVGHRADHRQHRGRRHLQPADLARGLRSDQPRLDGADHGRCARAGGVVRGAVAAATGRRRAVRLRAGRVRQRVGVHQRLVLLDHRLGGQRRHRGRLGPLRRALHQHRTTTRSSRCCWCWSDSGFPRRSTCPA